MSSAQYERLPPLPASDTELPPHSSTRLDLDEEEVNVGREPPAHRIVFSRDPRFEIPTPPRWQRAALLLFIVFLFWLGYQLRGSPSDEGIPAMIE
ncbi:hypothetical protein EW145_g1560 [Phellinidium pouzarii]|uniref:Uncharacterized protein n=1 Tax=Phellinidium pouzarii TaxID=167371 RepID=A0A4S4LEE7_9AGAM|nr:hypothetical protein EW145_g1560 [Phellinidium pouzarii]